MSRIVSGTTIPCNIINNIQGFDSIQAVVSSDEVRGLQINILESDNEDGLFGKYCPIASSMSAFQMNDSALTVGAAATATTTDSSWNGTCNQSKEDQVEQQQEGSEHDIRAANQLVFPTYINNIADSDVSIMQKTSGGPSCPQWWSYLWEKWAWIYGERPKRKSRCPRWIHPVEDHRQVIQTLLSSGQFDKKYLPNKNQPLASKANKNKDDIMSFTKARANDGDTVSMVELGDIYLKVWVVGKEEKTAPSWLNATSEKGGSIWKADCLSMGMGVVQEDCEQAKCLLLETATEDHSGKFLCKNPISNYWRIRFKFGGWMI